MLIYVSNELKSIASFHDLTSRKIHDDVGNSFGMNLVSDSRVLRRYGSSGTGQKTASNEGQSTMRN